MAYPPAVKSRARKLRKEGKSYSEIARSLGLSKSTVREWVRDVVLSESQQLRLDRKGRNREGALAASLVMQERAKDRRERWRLAGVQQAESDELTRLVAALYWAEGAKWRKSFLFSNSDPDMVALVLRWVLRLVEQKDVGLRVQFHGANGLSEAQIADWWLSKLPGLDTTNLKKFTNVTKTLSRGKKTGKLPYGVARLEVHSTDLRMRTDGAISYLKGQLKGPLV